MTDFAHPHSLPAHLSIERASLDDLPAIVDIYNQSIASKQSTAYLTPISVSERQAWFDEHHNNPNRPLYVLKNTQQNILAWGCFSDAYARPAYHISSEISIYVHHQNLKQGLGQIMLDYMLQQTCKLGIINILALIFAHNQPSLALFKKFGFEQWGIMPKVCDMDGFFADVVILGKNVAEESHSKTA